MPIRSMKIALLALVFVLAAVTGAPQAPRKGHPYPQPLPGPSTQTTVGDTTTVSTGASLFPPSQPFLDPPGTNFLPTVYTNLFDSNGVEIPNTLPSTPTVPYNLHDGDPVVSTVNPISPTSDLQRIFTTIHQLLDRQGRDPYDERKIKELIQLGIDMAEGNRIPSRAYSGFPLLHYDGPDKLKPVKPIHDDDGKLIGGNVDVHQIWFDGRIEGDTNMVDPTAVLDVPWTITYTVDVLDRGEDDFSPFAMYFDAAMTAPVPPPQTAPTAMAQPAAMGPPPLAGMDQSFFPMEDGTRTVFKIKMAPAKYFNLVYVWGWRMHPPRVQVIENSTKKVGGVGLHDWEVQVFGPAPKSSEEAKMAAIAKIGDLAPAKRMWKEFREARTAADQGNWKRVRELMWGTEDEKKNVKESEARRAFTDWKERLQLPSGIRPDQSSDLTLFYVNNTIYGEFSGGGLTTMFPKWQTRGTELKVTLYNGDYFDHMYQNVDFGGARGWENQFKSSVKVGGSGCWFTFGRNYWWMNLATPITIPAASPYKDLEPKKVHITFNYDPSRRLRFYQFDPAHHDVAVFSVH